MELFKLFGSILINRKEAEEDIDKVDEKAQGLGEKFGNMMGTVGKWGSIITGAATAAGGALMKLADNTAEYSDQIDKLSERTGINREELQRWKYAAGQSGADVEKLEMGIKTLSNAMDAAVNGSEDSQAAFQKLGISLDDLKNKSQEEIFNTVMNGLADMEKGAARNALGNDLLSKSYTEMLPLLNAGSQGMTDLKDRADELGLVMSEDMIKANVEYGDTMDDLKQSFGAVTMDLTNSMLPMFQQFASFLIDNMPIIQSTVGGVFTSIGTAVQALTPFFMTLIETILPQLTGLFSQLTGTVLPPLLTLFTNVITTILPPLVTLLTEIASNILPPLIELFSGIIATILPPLTELFRVIIDQILPPFVDIFTKIIDTILPPLMDLFNEIISTLLPPLIDLFTQIIEAIMPVLMEYFNQYVEQVLPPFMDLIKVIVEEIMPPLLAIFNELAEVVLPLVMDVFKAMQPVIEPIMKAIAAVIKTVTSLIKGDWEGVWNGIKDFFTNIWDAIVKFAEGLGKVFGDIFSGIGKIISDIWNGIVQGIKDAINWIIGGINTLIDGLSSVTEAVGSVIGVDLSIPHIPYLAEGGTILKSGAAIVGEAGPELINLPTGATVTPLTGDKAAGLTLNIWYPNIMNDNDADRFGEMLVGRLEQLGVV